MALADDLLRGVSDAWAGPVLGGVDAVVLGVEGCSMEGIESLLAGSFKHSAPT